MADTVVKVRFVQGSFRGTSGSCEGSSWLFEEKCTSESEDV